MKNEIIEQIINDIDLPYEIKEKAKERYVDLGEWLNRPDSTIVQYSPYVFPQGSFLLQTTIRPIGDKGEYDLDIGCKFKKGLSDKTISQKGLKELLKEELNAYRIARNIKLPVEEKRRCWRLEYQDKMSFHIDIVPCLPAHNFDYRLYGHSYSETYLEKELLLNEENMTAWSSLALLITDKDNPYYSRISDKWHHSNPEGFAKWFRAKAAQSLLLEVKAARVKGKVADLPISSSKQDTVLQRVVKLLKRHRDVFFESNNKYKPISVIISKLSADAYSGENELSFALRKIIDSMLKIVDNANLKVLNPTETRENFADKWPVSQKYYMNFKTWLLQAKRDFGSLTSDELSPLVAESVITKKFQLQYGNNYAKFLPAEQETSVPETSRPIQLHSATIKPWSE